MRGDDGDDAVAHAASYTDASVRGANVIRALIVDDEEHAQRGIVSRLRKFTDIEVVGVCGNAREAVEAIRLLAPVLLFLDIQLPGETGFEVLEAIGTDACPLVIFVTAYDRYAMRAFEVRALDYLLKPIDDERFNAAVARAREVLAQRQNAQFRRRLALLLEDVNRSLPCKSAAASSDRLFVRSGGRIIFVSIADIDWIAASGDYVTLHVGKKSWLMRETISAIERQVEPLGFSRIHRSAVVNRERIIELRYHDNGDYRVLLRNGTELKLSRNYYGAFQRLLSPRAE
jgi:two-component system, LytTR family, response regulator